MHEAAQAYRAKDYGAWRHAQHEEEDLRLHLAQTFSEARRWRPAKAGFDLPTLARGGTSTDWMTALQNSPVMVTRAVLDHPYYFKRNRKAAAIAAHLYNYPDCKEQCISVARAFDVTFEAPDFPSWWFPGGTTLVLYIGPAGL
jgi:hypothetical protein